ncbi:MAG TPA: VOC family protein [Gemmatimonadaceae bacterium]|nr:VOC family protein [Gemmatimonadaceae bacterium]
MNADQNGTSAPPLVPAIAYDDAPAAIRWLTDVLGLRLIRKFEMSDGTIAHAELAWRTSMVFVHARPGRENPWSVVGPASIALAVDAADEVDRHFQRAVAAGADIVRPAYDSVTPAFPEGARQFDVRDPEGNLWTIGTYRPRITPDVR